jgi:dihydroflavonol-4-reductase
MKVLLTGPDGVLGNNLVRKLIEKEYSVRVLIQSGKKAPLLDDLPIERKYGDILQKDDLVKAVSGCDIIIHAAAMTDSWPSKHEKFWKVNVDGTVNMIEAAREASVKRFLHIGTATSFGPGNKQNPGTEQSEYCADRYGFDYISSKYEAQRIVLEEVEKGFDAVILNPTFMIGPYDAKPSSGALILGVNSGKVPGYPAGGKNFVSVKDVADAIVNAIELGKTGESYILGNENLNYKEIFQEIADTLGVKAPKRALPKFLILAYGLVMSFAANVFRFTPDAGYKMALLSTVEFFYDPKKAREELKMPQTPVDTALKEAVTWFRNNGYIE